MAVSIAFPQKRQLVGGGATARRWNRPSKRRERSPILVPFSVSLFCLCRFKNRDRSPTLTIQKLRAGIETTMQTQNESMRFQGPVGRLATWAIVCLLIGITGCSKSEPTTQNSQMPAKKKSVSQAALPKPQSDSPTRQEESDREPNSRNRKVDLSPPNEKSDEDEDEYTPGGLTADDLEMQDQDDDEYVYDPEAERRLELERQKQLEKEFEIPSDWKRLHPERQVWIDFENKRVILGGQICSPRGPLEMFACPAQTKEHESVVSLNILAADAHAGLLACGMRPGKTVQHEPKFVPASGAKIRVEVQWKEDGKIKTRLAREMVRHIESKKELQYDWVFCGSGFWKDPDTNENYYLAESGPLICVSNFANAMMDLPIQSSAEAYDALFEANAEKIPPAGTWVFVVLSQITDEKSANDASSSGSPKDTVTPSKEDPQGNPKAEKGGQEEPNGGKPDAGESSREPKKDESSSNQAKPASDESQRPAEPENNEGGDGDVSDQ